MARARSSPSCNRTPSLRLLSMLARCRSGSPLMPGLKRSEVHDAFGYASGALVYRLRLPPRGDATIGLVLPLFPGPQLSSDLAGMSLREWLQRQRDAVAASWRDKLNRVRFRVPPAAQPLVDTLRTALGARPDQARRPGAAAGHALLRALLDPRRRDDLGSAAAPRARGRRGRLPALVRAVSVRQRQGAVLRRRARRRSGARKRQPRRVHLPGRRGLSLHARSRAAGSDVAARRSGGALHGIACGSPSAPTPRTGARAACVLRPAAGVDQPRRLFGQADALVLGRLLGAEGLQGRG